MSQATTNLETFALALHEYHYLTEFQLVCIHDPLVFFISIHQYEVYQDGLMTLAVKMPF